MENLPPECCESDSHSLTAARQMSELKLTHLPPEVWTHIFQFADDPTLDELYYTCRFFRAIILEHLHARYIDILFSRSKYANLEHAFQIAKQKHISDNAFKGIKYLLLMREHPEIEITETETSIAVRHIVDDQIQCIWMFCWFKRNSNRLKNFYGKFDGNCCCGKPLLGYELQCGHVGGSMYMGKDKHLAEKQLAERKYCLTLCYRAVRALQTSKPLHSMKFMGGYIERGKDFCRLRKGGSSCRHHEELNKLLSQIN